MTSIISSATATAADVAHAAIASVLSASQISPGTAIPDIQVKETDPIETLSLQNLPGRNVILGIPGAFTSACSRQVPEYVSKFKNFQDKGVLGVYVVSVNDVYVMKAWKKNIAPEGTPVRFIADDKGAFNSGIGLIFDATRDLGGPRAKRYVLVVDDGRVTAVYVEKQVHDVTVTAPDAVLNTL